MKKLFYLVLAFGMLVMSASCQRNLVTFEYGASYAGVTFPAEQQIVTMRPEDGNKILVELVRGNVKGAVSIPVEITDYTEGVFTPAKTKFDFKDGENKAYIEFTYPSIEDFGGETYTIDLEITDEEALNQLAITGNCKVTVSAQRYLTKVPVGEVTIESLYWSEDGETPVVCKCKLYNTVEAPNYYIIPKMYKELAGEWDYTTTYDIAFIMEGDKITFPDQAVYNYSESYGDVWIEDVEASKTGNVITFEAGWYLKDYYNYPFGSSIEKITLPEIQ